MPADLTWMIERYAIDSVATDPSPEEETTDSSPSETSTTSNADTATGSAIADQTAASQTVAGQTVTVVMPIASEQWLERLLLRLGRRATVLSPPKWTDLAARAARAVLSRYEVGSRS
jgi:predicted DNA-binding transcriptional regulator YafY